MPYKKKKSYSKVFIKLIQKKLSNTIMYYCLNYMCMSAQCPILSSYSKF